MTCGKLIHLNTKHIDSTWAPHGPHLEHITQHTASCPGRQTARSHSGWTATPSPDWAWARPCCCTTWRAPRDGRCWLRSRGHPLRGRGHPSTAGACPAVSQARRRCSWEGRGTCTCSLAAIECVCKGRVTCMRGWGLEACIM